MTTKRFFILDITHSISNDVYCVYAYDSLLETIIVADYFCKTPTSHDVKTELVAFSAGTFSRFYSLSPLAIEHKIYNKQIAAILANHQHEVNNPT